MSSLTAEPIGPSAIRLVLFVGVAGAVTWPASEFEFVDDSPPGVLERWDMVELRELGAPTIDAAPVAFGNHMLLAGCGVTMST